MAATDITDVDITAAGSTAGWRALMRQPDSMAAWVADSTAVEADSMAEVEATGANRPSSH